MARKNQTYTEDQKSVALAFLERLRGDFTAAAKKAKVAEAALRVWYADGLKNKPEETPPARGPILVAAPFLNADPSTFIRAAINRSTRENELDEGGPINRLIRPFPPEHLMRPERWPSLFEPAHDVMDWMKAALIEEDAPLYDAEQWHLAMANIGVLWTNVEYFRQGKAAWGTAEIPLKQTKGAWAKAKEAQQLMNWFGGEIPDFLLTLDAVICGASGDREWCSGVAHELMHCFYKTDAFGAMKMNSDNDTGLETPCWTTRGHCVEEFVRIGELFGAEACAGRTMDFHAALGRRPVWTNDDIARACGRAS